MTHADRFMLCFCLFLDGDMLAYVTTPTLATNFLIFFLMQHLGTSYNLLPSPFALHQSFNQELSHPLHLLPPPAPPAQQSDTLRAKNPIAIVMSELHETGRLSRGLQNRAFFPHSCQTGLNTVFSVVTLRHTITIIDVQLRTSSLYIFSRRAAACSCSCDGAQCN